MFDASAFSIVLVLNNVLVGKVGSNAFVLHYLFRNVTKTTFQRHFDLFFGLDINA